MQLFIAENSTYENKFTSVTCLSESFSLLGVQFPFMPPNKMVQALISYAMRSQGLNIS